MASRVLLALDTAKIQLYHFKAIIIAGMGLFTDAYDLFSISPIMILIGHTYYNNHENDNETPALVVSIMVGISLLGTVIGQLVFGRLGDLIGRRGMYGISLMLMVLSSFACGFSICTKRGCVLASLAFFRFVLGVGIGGDYPLSATIMSEFANTKTRGGFIAAVFSMQGVGILASSIVTMVVCAIFDRASKENPTPEGTDIAWRLILMLGAIPAGMTFYWRMKMPETARYTALVEHNEIQASQDMQRVLHVSLSPIPEESPLPQNTQPSYPLFSKKFFRRHGRDLFACGTSWFLVDIVFYSSNLFQYQIYTKYISQKDKANAFKEAFQVAGLQAIVAVCSTLPGYFATVYFIDRIGRVKIQMMGFFFMAVVYFSMVISYKYWDDKESKGFMVLYGITFFFANFGPNTTTFIVPAELFPARFRTTCHGISGAAGKVGAIIGAVGFFWASHDHKEDGFPRAIGMRNSLVILGGVCIMGMVVTHFFTPETTGRSLEENESADDNELSLIETSLRSDSNCPLS